ncbi:MAG: hypothetical protein ACE5JB_07425 [bacterium]
MKGGLFWIATGLLMIFIFMSCQKKDEKKELSNSHVKEVIVNYIKNETGPEGTFAIEDTIEVKTWQLTYDYVHESVHKAEDGRYYACVDFTEGDNRLDLDLYVAKEDDELKISEVVIHKVNGESRW